MPAPEIRNDGGRGSGGDRESGSGRDVFFVASEMRTHFSGAQMMFSPMCANPFLSPLSVAVHVATCGALVGRVRKNQVDIQLHTHTPGFRQVFLAL